MTWQLALVIVSGGKYEVFRGFGGLMARLVEERHNGTGALVYRMKMQEYGGGRMFCLTFDDAEAAKGWIAKNEEDFKVDSQLFFDWREELYLKMKRRGDIVHKHIVIPRLRKQL